MGISQTEFDAQTKERIAKDAAAKAAFDAIVIPTEAEQQAKEAGKTAPVAVAPATASLVETEASDEESHDPSYTLEDESAIEEHKESAPQVGWFRRLLNKLS
jgi:hypothetical protein